MIRVGILGAAGYTGGELIRLLVHHPQVEIAFANSESNAGNAVTQVHEGLYGDTDLAFTADLPFDQADVLFFCFGHGKSRQFLAEHHIPDHVRIVDLAQDFRIASPEHDYVYGLPEIHRPQICTARHIANPGCFATAIQLGLLPLAKAGLLTHDVSVNAITGSTGAGQKPTASTHFSWRDSNISTYKVFTHQHLAEIEQSLNELQPAPHVGKDDVAIDFVPCRGDFPRGIFCTEIVRLDRSDIDVAALYRDFYRDAAFTHYVDTPLDLKQVVNTNKCLLHIDQFDHKVVVTSIIDNLLKGAVGQAVQNMNLMFGIDEKAGLRLKASAF
ncbi:MAG: N-acetyl-gamma-glutamyl-phosphate reductase [Prevotellaceae bacterium]|nr:N-acetyl-gamma-glutamyl-phosphate reductase [Prevotellaceae bacterium]